MSETSIKSGVTGYTAELDGDMCQFQRIAWPDRNYESAWPYWRWALLDSADRVASTPKVWLYAEDEKIVGEQGAIPVKLKAGESVLEAQWFIDTMVLDDYQDRPVGPQLFFQASRGCSLPLSLGQTEYMKKLLLAGGWRDIGVLNRFVYPLNSSQVLEGKVANGLLRWIAGSAMDAVAALRRWYLEKTLDSGAAPSEVHAFGDEFDELWEASSKHLHCSVVRDASYLNWRYAGRHERNYHRIALHRDGVLDSLVVLAIAPPTASYPHQRMFLVDLVARAYDAKTIWAAMSAAIDFARQHQVDALHFYLQFDPLRQLLTKFGFFERPGTHCLLAGARRVPQEIKDALAEAENWYCTMGDSDVEPSTVGHENPRGVPLQGSERDGLQGS